MAKILITGGAGYIGSHATKLFLEKGHDVTVFDNLCNGYSDAIDALIPFGNLNFIKGDLRNKADINSALKSDNFDAVLHFAALCSVNESMEEPELYFENNVVGSLNLFEAMRRAEVKKLIFSSTCAVYGESQYLPMDTNHPTNPANPYGESKLLVEKIIKWYGEIHDLSYIIFRYFNVCGADSDGVIGDSKKPSSLLVQNAVRGAMGIEKFYLTCPKVDTPDGTPIRDYIDVEDLASAHLAAYKYINNGGSSEFLNLGNGSGFSVKQIVDTVEPIFDVNLDSQQAEPRKGEYAEVYADPSKAIDLLNWKPEKSLKDSIISLKKWYEKHPDGWEK